ncbi:MAG: ABC transporter permease [Treponema sp.]|jgi:lipoprotein-releasing system permease protein|nr:ABC transporter permease [Treponema sp.]
MTGTRKFSFPFWIGFVASRHVRRGRGKSPSPVFAVLGIATGVLALTVIIAVMNGFQLGFIENILEISSYHVRLEDFPPEDTETLRQTLAAAPGITAAVPFCEFQALIRGGGDRQAGLLVRGLPPEAPELDRGMASKLEFEAGSFDISRDGTILLGTELARSLSARLGDTVTIFSVDDLFGGPGAGVNSFTVTGIFRTGYYDYDMGLALMKITTALSLSQTPPVLGFKLRDRWQDSAAIESLGRLVPGAKLSGWRDYNRSFFGALRTEKLFMFILVGLIFIVVGLNIFQAQRRAVLERREEIGLLRAVGAGDFSVRMVFAWDGFLIGICGAGTGLALGLLVASRIGAFFDLVEGFINVCINVINYLSGSFFGSGNFEVFSPAVYYIKEIPSRIIPHEVFLIFMFGFLSALLAAWFASGRVSRTKPAEVLRDE